MFYLPKVSPVYLLLLVPFYVYIVARFLPLWSASQPLPRTARWLGVASALALFWAYNPASLCNLEYELQCVYYNQTGTLVWFLQSAIIMFALAEYKNIFARVIFWLCLVLCLLLTAIILFEVMSFLARQ